MLTHPTIWWPMDRPWASTKKMKVRNMRIETKDMKPNLIGPHVWDEYVGSNEAPSHRRHPTTIAHWPPVPVDRLKQVLKVPWTHPTL